ncbi:homeobox-leucine zipper protein PROTODERMALFACTOR 2, partial [Striga asiatica]
EGVRCWDGFKLVKGGGIQYSDLTGDSSLARAFESKHGHPQLRGSSRSSIDEPGRVHSKVVPYSGCKAEEAILPAPPAVRVFDLKGIENERKIFTIYGVE